VLEVLWMLSMVPPSMLAEIDKCLRVARWTSLGQQLKPIANNRDHVVSVLARRSTRSDQRRQQRPLFGRRLRCLTETMKNLVCVGCLPTFVDGRPSNFSFFRRALAWHHKMSQIWATSSIIEGCQCHIPPKTNKKNEASHR